MHITQTPSVVLDHLRFEWPDGDPVVTDLCAAFGSGRTGLTGPNGTGKSTLLRLIAGELAPTSGSIAVTGQVGYLSQHLPLATDTTVAELLGARRRLDALRAIEAGDADPRHFDTLGDDWDIEARVRAELDGIGLAGIGADRRVGSLSGGETVLAALAGLRLAGDEIVLLDEPTNKLDRDSRQRLYDTVLAWRGALIVVSHDVALLDLMDDTAELRTGGITLFGGPTPPIGSTWTGSGRRPSRGCGQPSRNSGPSSASGSRRRPNSPAGSAMPAPTSRTSANRRSS